MPPDFQIRYDCQRCTACCRWPGYVAVTEREIKEIARHLGTTEDSFIQNHTRLQPNRKGLALLDKPNGECAMLEGINCRIQPVKPKQCRQFPNEWNFPGWRDSCEATPRLHRAMDAK